MGVLLAVLIHWWGVFARRPGSEPVAHRPDSRRQARVTPVGEPPKPARGAVVSAESWPRPTRRAPPGHSCGPGSPARPPGRGRPRRGRDEGCRDALGQRLVPPGADSCCVRANSAFCSAESSAMNCGSCFSASSRIAVPKTVGRMAKPSEPPTCCVVLSSPDAAPASCGATPETAVSVSVTKVSPRTRCRRLERPDDGGCRRRRPDRQGRGLPALAVRGGPCRRRSARRSAAFRRGTRRRVGYVRISWRCVCEPGTRCSSTPVSRFAQ